MRTFLAACVIAFGALAQSQGDPTQEKSPTQTNDQNRAASAPKSEREQFEEVPGGPATPKSQWRTGDERGKPQARRQKARKAKTKKKAPAKETQR
jgi:hypothetical protein